MKLAQMVGGWVLCGGWLALAEPILHVQVSREGTGTPVEGADVRLDLLPEDGAPEHAGETDPFGFARFSPAAGTHRISVTRPGYQAMLGTVVLAANAGTHTNVLLQAVVPPGGGDPDPGQDLRLEARCVMTGRPMAGAPVRVQVFATSNAVVTADTRTGETDANGNLALRGLPDGFYSFRVNDPLDGAAVPKWKKIESAQRYAITRDHSVRAGLEPEKQSVALAVRGLDVAHSNRFSATNQLLRGVYVELTGGDLDANGNFIALLPPRVAITDNAGAVSFAGLPALTWRASTKRLGYHPFNALLVPDDAGTLPALTTLRPALRSNKFFLTLTQPYTNRNLMQGLRVRVQGLEDTNTEGVDFTNPTVFFDGVNFRWDWHTIQNLLPGRYRLSVDANGTGVNIPAPGYRGEIYADLEDKLAANANLTWTDATLPLAAKTTLVRGRLWSAESMPASRVLLNDSIAVSPIYNAHTGGVQVVFREFEPVNPAQGPWLAPALRTITTTVDANGEFTVRLPSTRWGIEIPSLTSHFGSHCRLRNLTTTVASEQDLRHGWPYYRWPHASPPPSNGQPAFGASLIIRHEHEYELDLYLRRQILAVSGTVDGSAVDPVPGDLFIGPPGRRAKITLTPASGTPVTIPLEDSSGGNDGRFYFPDVPPGEYSITASHPRNTFRYAGGGASLPVSVPSFPAPGVVPDTDPDGFGISPFSNLHNAGAINADYTPSTSLVTFHAKEWNGSTYENRGSTTYFANMVADYLPKIRSGSNIPPVGGFTCWHDRFDQGIRKYIEARVNAEGEQVDVDVYYNGGPLANMGPLPPIPATVEVHVVVEDDPDSFVPGTQITLDSNPPFTATALPHILTNYGSFGFGNAVLNPHWIFTGATYSTPDPSEPRRKVVFRMRRATRFLGTVTAAAGGAPIPEVHVAVKDRFGNLLRDGATNAAGTFDFPSHVNASGPMFVEFSAFGFIPKRLRFGPENPVITPDPNDLNDKAVMTIDETLEAVPGPVVTDALLDRRGQFLPGIVRVGDTSQGTEGLATNELTMTWEILFDATTYTHDQPPFDAPDGTPPTPGPVSVVDEITDVLLVDPRFFGATGTVSTAQFGNPYSALPNPLNFPPVTLFNSVRKFIKDLGGPLAPSVSFHRAEELEKTGPNTWAARGTVPLWLLPAGLYTPRVIALTRRGAVTYHDLVGEELEGVRVPRSLGFMADVMSAVSRNAPLVDHVASYLPSGRFVARPDFVTEIHEGATAPGYLDYLFQLGVTANESMDNPGNAELGFMPGGLGLNIVAQAEATFDGKAKKVGLTIRGDLTATEDIDISDYAPPFLKPYNPVLTLKEPSGGLQTTLSRTFPGGGPNALELVHVTNGGIGFAAALNLTPAVSRIPQIGPVLLALDKANLLTVGGDLDARIDLISTRAWATRYPVPGETLPVDRELRRHFLGGDEQTSTLVNSNSVDLAFNFGMGLSVALGGERAGARGGLRLAGEDHPRTGRPSLVLTANPDGDWPLFTRIRGQVKAELSAFLDVWVTRLERDYSWLLASFDVPLSTEGNLVVTPIEGAWRVITPTTPASFTGGSGPDLAAGLHPTAPFLVHPGAPPVLVYADPNGGPMSLRVSDLAAPGGWQAPDNVVSSGGIVDFSLLARPSSGVLLAWSQIAPADYANPLCGSSVHFVTGPSAGPWSAATPAATLDGVAHHLTLVRSGTLAALVFLESRQGPASPRADLRAMVWNDGPGSFSAPVTLATNLDLHGLTVAGDPSASTPEILLVQANPAGDLFSRTWDGTTLSSESPLASGSFGVPALAPDTGGAFRLLWMAPDALRQKRYTPGGGWSDLPNLSPGPVVADDLAFARIPGATQDVHLAVWTSSGPASALWHVFSDASGNPLGLPVNLSQNGVGDYADPVLLPETDGSARLLARFTASPAKLREFRIALTPSAQETDRDGDGYADVWELALIDADPDDAVTTLAQVTPTGDFDGDGIGNAAETFMGTDPANPASVLRIRSIDFVDGDAGLAFDSAFGVEYELQVNPDLSNPVGWLPAGTITGTGRREALPAAFLPGGAAHYRVVVAVP